MLNPKGKTPRPEWVQPYEPQWMEGQWVVIFAEKRDAQSALASMQADTHERLACAPYPDGSNCWYVGVLS
jgi:hypothetical protein